MVEKIQSTRMRAAKLAAAAARLKQRSGVTAPVFSLAFMSDRDRAPDPEIIAHALPAGAAVIVRDYDHPHREALARRLKSICAARGLILLIGADAGLARRVGADGVHLPSWAQKQALAQGHKKSGILSAACHSAAELRAAASISADIALLSPVFATRSHVGAPFLGPGAFKALAARSTIPVLALGGVDEAKASALMGPNVAGLAAIDAFKAR